MSEQHSNTLNIAVIVGSTRPNRIGPDVAEFVVNAAKDRPNARYELVDIASFNLPILDEPVNAAAGQYEHEHTQRWSAKISEFDGFIFVTPEYNHSTSGALKNALDFLYNEWVNKACAFVGYGFSDGVRAVEHLRGIVANFSMADVRAQGAFSLIADVQDGKFAPRDFQAGALKNVFDQVELWAGALRTIR